MNNLINISGYTGDMMDLPLETAENVYRSKDWDWLYDSLPYPVAFQLLLSFETGI